MIEWVEWKTQKPKTRGNYLFAIHSGGNSYSNHTDIEIRWFDPDTPYYGITAHEMPINDMGEFFTIIAWKNLSEFPSHFINRKDKP